ncbi:MAG: hypothetical protein ACOCVF_00370 [bacterium]
MSNFFLESGELNSVNGCQIDDYVIDWKKDNISGSTVFTSAAPDNLEYQATHPFKDEPVSSGTLYPVIRYAVLNGEKYSAEPMAGAKLSSDFKTCLSGQAITIDEINCATQYNQDGNYDYRLIYDRTLYSSNKSREFNFNLNTSNKYVAFALEGDDIADQIKIKYCSDSNPEGVLIENFVTGIRLLNSYDLNTTTLESNHFPVDYPNTPKFHYHYYTGPNVRNVINLDLVASDNGITRTNNDWLNINIIGSYNNSNYNETKWETGLICLDEHLPVPDYTEATEIDISSLNENSLKYLENSCGRFILTFNNKGTFNRYPYDYYYNYFINASVNGTERLTSIDIREEYVISTSTLSSNKVFFTETTVEKTVGKLKLTFTNNELYKLYVDSIKNRLNYLSTYGGYNASRTNTEYQYFCYIIVGIYKEGLNCGDDKNFYRFFIHPSSTFDFGNEVDTNEIIINLNEIEVGIDDLECDGGLYNNATHRATQINETYNSVFNFTSRCFTDDITGQKHFVSIYIKREPIDNIKTSSFKYYFPSYINDNYDLLNNGFYIENNSWYSLYFYNIKLEITADLTNYNNNDSADRAKVENNWILYANNKYIDRNDSSSGWTKIIEVSDGNVIYSFDPFS